MTTAQLTQGKWRAGPADNGELLLDLRALLRVLRRQVWAILCSTLLLFAACLFLTLQITPLYEAEAIVMIDPREPRVVDVDAVLAGLSADAETVRGEIEVIRSRDLAAKTVAALHLADDPVFNEALVPPTFLESWLDLRRLLPEAWHAAFGLADGTLDLAARAEREFARVVEVFLEHLEVTPQGRSRVIRIAFQCQDPVHAAQIVDTLTDRYLVAQLDAKFDATRRANQWLTDRLAALREQVETSERAIESFREASGLLRGKDSTLAAQQISELNTQLVLERTKRAESDARLHQVEALMTAPGGRETVSEVLQSPLIQRLREQEAAVERNVAELAGEYGDKHPRMINTRAELTDLRQKISLEVGRIIEGLRNEVAVARAREASLAAALDDLKEEVGRLNGAEVKLRALEREAAANRVLFETFLARSKETDAQQSFQRADARIVSRAAVPDEPAFPNLPLFAGVSLVGSTLIGFLFGFLIEQLDPGFRGNTQVEAATGLPSLGLVPALPRRARRGGSPGRYLLDRPKSAYAEAIRSVNTALFYGDSKRPPKVVLIASALPGEGKTALAASLAHLHALAGHKVVVVDADLRRPSAHREFAAAAQPGLTDCLLGLATLTEALVEDPRSGAFLLPAGTAPENAPELLGSARMRGLLDKLVETCDLVILDSPPLLAVSDARVLSRLADTTVYLVRWGKTRRETALAGLKSIRDAGGEVAGVLLSQVNVKRNALYGYGESGTYTGALAKYYRG